MSTPHTIGEMSITDEHVVLEVKTKMKKIVAILDKDLSTAILLNQKKQGIVGVITIDDVKQAVNEGKNVRKMKAKDLMCTDLLELHDDVPLEDALAVIKEQRPAAVIVRQQDGSFAGFFSPEDYAEAEEMLASRETQAESFEERASEFASELSDLAQEMYDGDDAPEDEPSTDLSSIPMSDAERFLSRVRNQAADGDDRPDVLDLVEEAVPAVLDPLIDVAQQTLETVVEQATVRVAGIDAAETVGELVHELGEELQEAVTGHVEQKSRFCPRCGTRIPAAQDICDACAQPQAAPAPSGPSGPPSGPATSLKGALGDDGYEWIVFPPGSSHYYYRDSPGQNWIIWMD